MSGGPMRVVRGLALLLAAAAACAFAWSTLPGGMGGGPREVVVVARDMAFTVAGETGPNPTLRLRAGERVLLVLENRDPGMLHDLVAPGLGLRTATIGFGVSDRVRLTAPSVPGEHDYFCTFHDRLMRGRVVVE